MGVVSKISWCTSSWNPWFGCKTVSPGCTACYAEAWCKRTGRDFNTVTRTADATFYAPLRWKEPKRIFVCSLSDFFIKQADQWREEAWGIMQRANRHTYIILTKRPGLMAEWAKTHLWPDHIWAGVTVESPKYLPRLDVLKRVPAKVCVVSCEPLLGPLDLTHIPLGTDHWYDCLSGWESGGLRRDGLPTWSKTHPTKRLNWVITGGESGPGHRPMQTEWVREIVRQCRAAGTPCFVKQDSNRYPGQQGNLPDDLWAVKEIPNAV